ncbi:MAG: acyltransferase domain-containing protein [Desulfovibrionaceae bacterium]|nr:acyltransferase domain-containing protein [Desulfovibrionaceae bacterium]
MPHPDYPPHITPELYLDGVYYARFVQNESTWLVGSTAPSYRESLVLLGSDPTQESLDLLTSKGIFARRHGERSKIAVLCDGMGGVFPGMGRELYDQFPLAREAMDKIQSVSSWDVLSLLDESDPEVINSTRFQIPYLFLLEYAQWSYLAQLGFKPDLICGHSLGELIGLCLGGIYSYDVAWHILDTRADHVATLEARAEQDFGMLAVHAGIETVEDVLAKWSEVRVANYNTPKQFILNGPKEVLQEIRSFLRKQRIPAVSISVSLLFHHPWMRILRDLSLVRLNGLQMQKASIPVLGVASLDLYPETKAEICQTIADLDENPVRFSACLQKMWNEYGVRSFLELGPQDILCGLVADNLSQAHVLACGRKGHEAESLRQLAARLYAEGFLEQKCLERCQQSFARSLEPELETELVDQASKDSEAKIGDVSFEPKDLGVADLADLYNASADAIQPILELLSNLASVPIDKLKPETDLRHDLRLRSSSYPVLIAKAEQLFQHTPSFEDLLKVVTIRDLISVFQGRELIARVSEQGLPHLPRLEPLQSFVWTNFGLTMQGFRHQPRYAELLSNLDAKLVLELGAPDFKCADNDRPYFLADLLASLNPLVQKVILPEELGHFKDIFSKDAQEKLIFDGKVLPPKICPFLGLIIWDEGVEVAKILDVLRAFDKSKIKGNIKPTIFVLRLNKTLDDALANLKSNFDWQILACEAKSALRLVLVEYPKISLRRRFLELGDLVAKEIFVGENTHALWLTKKQWLDLEKKYKISPTSPQKDVCGDVNSYVCAHGFAFSGQIPHLTPSCGRIANTTKGFTLVPSRTKPGQILAKQFLGQAFFPNSTQLKQRDLVLTEFLALLLKAAQSLCPWLKVIGFSDILVARMPSIPQGATLECKVKAEAIAWLEIYQTLTRQCQGYVSAHLIEANGRESHVSTDLLHGTILLAQTLILQPSLGEFPVDFKPSTNLLAAYTAFAAQMSPSQSHILFVIKAIARCDEFWRVEIRPDFEGLEVAWGSESAYNFLLELGERAAVFTLFAIILGDMSPKDSAPDFEGSIKSDLFALADSWQIGQVGFILFGNIKETDILVIDFKRTWKTKNIERFDLHIHNNHGETFLKIFHLEWQKVL